MLTHHDVHRYAETGGLPGAPCTTVICVLAQRGSLHWAYAGDPCMYLMRKGELVTRTRDRSEIEDLLQQDCALPM